MIHLSRAGCAILTQLQDVISKIPEDDFRRPLSTLSGATVGQHVRHALEFFDCLMNGVKTGVVNYDQRRRDKEIETDPSVAITCIERVRNLVLSASGSMPLTMEVCYDITSGRFATIETNYHRELAYNVEHVTHHMAILKIGIKELAPDLALPEHFGVAVSTVRYRGEGSVVLRALTGGGDGSADEGLA